MQCLITTFIDFTNNQLEQEETNCIKAGGEPNLNPLFVDPVQQGENPLYEG